MISCWLCQRTAGNVAGMSPTESCASSFPVRLYLSAMSRLSLTCIRLLYRHFCRASSSASTPARRERSCSTLRSYACEQTTALTLRCNYSIRHAASWSFCCADRWRGKNTRCEKAAGAYLSSLSPDLGIRRLAMLLRISLPPHPRHISNPQLQRGWHVTHLRSRELGL